MSKILLVEDDPLLARETKEWLHHSAGYTVEVAPTGEDARQMLQSFGYDLIVLDWELPGMSGLDLCREFRRRGGQTPILFLTGRSGIDDKEMGFEQGADDYLAKPYTPRELSARCKALLRRGREQATLINESKKIILKPEENILIVGAQQLPLTKLECAVLQHLMSNPGKPYSASDLLKRVWPSDRESSEEAVRALVSALRKKLNQVEEGCAQNIIGTMPGGGYVYKP